MVQSNIVILDGRLIHRPTSGLERYVVGLATQLTSSEGKFSFAVTVEWPARVPPEISDRVIILPVFNEGHLPRVVRDTAPALYHLTWLGYSLLHYLPLGIADSGVLTIPDFILWDHPEYIPAELYTRYRESLCSGGRWADRIQVYSQYIKRLVIERLGIDESRIDVVPLAVDPRFSQPASFTRLSAIREQIGRPYLLTVGKDYPHKNLPRLVQALGQSGLREHALVVAGESVWPQGRQELRVLAQKYRIEDRLVLLDHVPEDDLPALYQGADAFVFPSLEEGFGIPPLEAMAAGVPVVASNAASLPEVVGDAALVVDATSTDELSAALSRVVGDASLRSDLREKGRARSTRFSWPTTVSLAVASYERAQQIAVRGRRKPRVESFVTTEAASLGTIRRYLNGRSTCPSCQVLIWITSRSFCEHLSEKLSRPCRRAFASWIRRYAHESVSVILAEDTSLSLSELVSFARPDCTIVVADGSESDPVLKIDGTTILRKKLDEFLEFAEAEALFDSSSRWISALNETVPDVQLLGVDLSSSLGTVLGVSGQTIGVFPLRGSAPLPEPGEWLDCMKARADQQNVSGEVWLVVGDRRASENLEWASNFRCLVDGLQPKVHLVWMVGAAGPDPSIGNPEDWIVVPVDAMSEDVGTALRQRMRCRIATTVRLGGPGELRGDWVEVISSVRAIRPERVIFDRELSADDEPLTRAAVDEICEASRDIDDRSIVSRLLQLRVALADSNSQLRDLYDGAMNSHLDGVRSFEKQLEVQRAQFHTLEALVTRLSRESRFS